MYEITPMEKIVWKSYKIALLGQAAVGKTCIIQRFIVDQFSDSVESTVGSSFQAKTQTIDEKQIRFEIWDTAGQEKYDAIAPLYFKTARSVIVTFDVTNIQTFDKAKQWVTEVRDRGLADCIICLAGNKSDKQMTVNWQDVVDYTTTEKIMLWKISAKTGLNIEDMFTAIGRELFKLKDIGPSKLEVPEKKGCC